MTLTVKGGLTLKVAEGDPEGTVKAVISTFNIKDLDGDVVTPEAIKDGTPVRLSAWGHNWEKLPVGRGVLKNNGKQAVFEGVFFMGTQAGRETYETVKGLAELQEWSWGFTVPDGGWRKGELNGERVRFIDKTKPIEVCPVMIGANPETGTLDIKSAPAEEVVEESTVEEGIEVEAPVEELEEKAADEEVVEKADEAEDTGPSSTAGAVEAAVNMVRRALQLQLAKDDCCYEDIWALTEVFRELEWFLWSERMEAVSEELSLMGAEDREVKRAHVAELLTKTVEELRGLALKSGELLITEEPVEDDVTTPYAREGERVAESIDGFIARSRSLADLRAKEGRVLSTANRDRLSGIAGQLSEAAKAIETLLTDTESAKGGVKSAQSGRDRELQIAAARARTLSNNL